ncbi:IS66 family insertion sequence element accessory protein TnpB, partial [Paraburkholderia sp. JPY454]|nr:IS66 family insertion sequence element accessory protein TnpB [Paraburkholderia youngii]
MAEGDIKVMHIISNLMGTTLTQSAEKKPGSRT